MQKLNGLGKKSIYSTWEWKNYLESVKISRFNNNNNNNNNIDNSLQPGEYCMHCQF